MADLKTQLEISADASGVEVGVAKAKRSLADLGASAASAGKQASEGLSGAGVGADGASRKIDATTKNIIGSIQRQIATMEAGSKSGAKYFEAIANQRGANLDTLKPYLDQLEAVRVKQQTVAAGFAKLGAQGRQNLERITAGDRIADGLALAGRQARQAAEDVEGVGKRGAVALNAVGMSAKQTAAALRGVPAQFTDIATSLAAGQAPLTVFLQQGGQLKDMFGGIGPAAKALGGYVVGLINPFTVAAGAAAALALAYKKGSEESDAFAKAIILSGNAAGTTVSALQAQAKAISEVVGTQGEAADALAQFAQDGNIASGNLQKFATVAIKLQRDAGQAVSETVKQFSELAKDPVAASVKLNETTRFLTLSLYQQIKALEETGRVAEAAAVAQKGYADALESRTGQLEQRLGAIERGWLGVKDAAKSAWDAMLNVGRPDTLQDQLAKAQETLKARLEAGGPRRGSLVSPQGFEAGNEALRNQIASLSERIRLENRVADAAKASADQVKARAQFDKDGEQFLTKQAKQEREIAKARAEGAAAGASQVEIEKRVADIKDKYKDKGATNAAKAIDKSELGFDLSKIKAESDQLINIYSNSERVLEALRSAGLVDEKDYYESKRAFIQLETEAKESAVRKEIDRLGQEKLSGKDRIDNDRKIAEAESRLAVLRADSSSRLEVLAIQQEAAVKRLGLAYLTARQAAQDYFDTTERQQARELEGVGQGREQRARNAGVSQIEDRYQSQRRDLENQKAQLEFEGKFNDEARKQYDQRLGIINEFQAKSLESFNAYYDRLLKKQQDFTVGASEATKNYITESRNIAAQTEEIFSRAFSNIEDSLVDFLETGRLSFKSFADELQRDILRSIVKQNFGKLLEVVQGQAGKGGVLGTIGDVLGGVLGSSKDAGGIAALGTTITSTSAAETAAITTAIGTSTAAIVAAIGGSAAASSASSIFSSGSTAFSAEGASDFGSFLGGFFADGGDPPLGKVSVVGERGPELFVPKRQGTIVPMDKIKATSSEPQPVNLTINNAFASGTDRRTIDQAASKFAQVAQRALARQT